MGYACKVFLLLCLWLVAPACATSPTPPTPRAKTLEEIIEEASGRDVPCEDMSDRNADVQCCLLSQQPFVMSCIFRAKKKKVQRGI
jgi:hypothetical protein